MELNLTKLRVLTQYNKQYLYNFCTIGLLLHALCQFIVVLSIVLEMLYLAIAILKTL